ncbi:MAG TPA: hypothetical protein VKB07_06410, partial [Gaiellaceae bacterium]|nr:hypothetical protein [Gaiellaceae bacterium]
MRRVALLACLAALASPSGAAAHPLGNFTVNRLAAVDLAGDRIYVRYVLDMAEIPTYQERKHVERAGYAREVARKLDLRLDGRRARLDVVRSRFGLKPGAGGLETLRFEAVFRARAAGSTLELRDGNYPNRLGWREMVVRARDGAELVAASVPDRSASDDLRSYAGELLDVRRATASFELGTRAGEAPALGPPGRAEPAGGFEALIAEPGTTMLALLLAAFWGAAHALTPGHGKAIVAGYLVGSRGKPRHAVALGLIVTV